MVYSQRRINSGHDSREGTGDPSKPVGVTALHSLEDAIRAIITRLYAGFSVQNTAHNVPKPERNAQIIARHTAGEGLSDLAREFGISPQRVDQIVKEAREKPWQP